ncbi:CD209 antigen-like protein 2 isoform X1 [Rousettus aegyptiacus]|uniref:CD209 antigen-like protein 2 isoform X1 n=1 Tax=Rousettus aegyptiacus TaxID=9407 RepID=UPI00168D28D8|nr:CD209 antigen-like protein 2 isoform X1 [Rousettus aegyptiacus]
MADMYDPKEPEEREIFHSQRSAEKYSGLPRRLRSLTGCLTQAPLLLMLLLISLGLFMLLLTTLVQVFRIGQSLRRDTDHQESYSLAVVFREQMHSDLQEVHQQLTWMNATMAGLCRPCPWDWTFFQGSCYMFSKTQSTWKASVSACEDMRAQLVIINNTEEQKFLKSWDAKNNKRAWIGLSDQNNEGSWKWVDDTPLRLSFWKEGEPNNIGDEDCVELNGDGWNDSICNADYFWICEKPSSPCPGL